MSAPPLSLLYGCMGKEAYRDRAAAFAALGRLRRKSARWRDEDENQRRNRMAPYYCNHCGLYHLGHRSRVK